MAHSIADDHVNPTPQRTVLLATDSKSSVLAEVSADKTNHVTYSVYGHQSAQQEVMTRLGFNGELREMQTRWYLLGDGYRAYNPRLMRFHSPDSWSPFGKGGLNPYMYCGGEPVMNKDPTGHGFFSIFRTGFNNLTDRMNTLVSTYQAQRAVGQNPVSALSSSVNGGMPNMLGALNPNGVSKLGAAPTNSLPTAKTGGLHHNVGGVPSSTPDRGTGASNPDSSGGPSMWDRLAARAQSTQVAVVKPNYGSSKQVAVVKPNQSTPPPAPASGSSSAPANRPVANVQPYRPTNDSASNSTWSGESGPSDWSSSSSNSSIRGSRR
ncbi:RHS repeat-associated core domain-containing protein [Pseudomonas fluorescens]|uniref:RHS repeat-associated core domain-containing protein n=1 Tax=Pseudomonas fluorescens TaxID=294 RepID=A0A5E7EUE3_PSEFL|nr:RHS repeat-associated core domain-containing protein [Pseudomonas fluorescens]VVO29887.1 hypothetical protein PS723_04901 [Pseudomonas fluorescens]